MFGEDTERVREGILEETVFHPGPEGEELGAEDGGNKQPRQEEGPLCTAACRVLHWLLGGTQTSFYSPRAKVECESCIDK